ncbi:unnamed protein product [Rhizoctonia solani]|uniref:Transmembrane protein n=1 Tax=Rhizoctonia solani TaxID=456999 RepID=A0A8H3ANH2_9AGAM|nr:unnamed protein product [Rhizoctonia solani]
MLISLLSRLRDKPVIIYTLIILLALFVLYNATTLPFDMDLDLDFNSEFELYNIPLRLGAGSKKMPATGLKLLVPCVPGSNGLEVKGREFRTRLRACGSISHLPGANETAVFAYHLSTLKRVTPLNAFKCKTALAYHVAMNPLPLWYPTPTVDEAKKAIPLPGILELGL